MTIQYGQAITRPDDPLQKVPLARLYQGIRHPKAALARQIKQLRILRSMDERQYRRRKTTLPYFTIAHFHPAIRRKANFTFTEGLILDLDHLQEAALDLAHLRARLQADARVLMAFTSPSADGLKLVFHLAERCYDAGLYAYFYQAFAQQFAQAYGLEKVLDFRTHDVTRACFLSIDPEAYYNEQAEALAIGQYFDATAPQATGQLDRRQQELLTTREPEAPIAPDNPLSEDVLQAIKGKLNPNYRPRRRKQEFEAPPAVKAHLPVLEARFEELELQLVEARPIQHGMQLRVGAPPHWAEVNIFHGQRGFSIVQSTKSGSQPELARMLVQIVEETLFPTS